MLTHFILIVCFDLCAPSIAVLNSSSSSPFQCSDNFSCSLNGVCNTLSHTCDCDDGWTSAQCAVLRLQPAEPVNESGGIYIPGK